MKIKFISVVACLLLSTSTFSQIKLPNLISDGIILQRDSELKLWGWASSKEKITLTFNHKKYKTTANKNGDWVIKIPAQKAGGPYKMLFKGKNSIEVNDILFGDVWLGTGQSNMVIPMERIKERFPEEVSTANYSEIRNFFIPTITNLEKPQNNLPKSKWKSAVKEDILDFGAITYFFAKDLYEKYHVPIGIINASVGGTPIESWISEEGFKDFSTELETIQINKNIEYTKQFTTRPTTTNTTSKIEDKGLSGKIKWYEENYEPKGWTNFYIPGYWEDQGVKNLNGVVWFRKEIDIPKSMVGEDVKIFMGTIVDADEVYFNGTKIGNITYKYPPRRYTISKDLVKIGKNIITIRVTNYGGKGGFVSDKNYSLVAKEKTIDLKGTWQYKVGEVFKPTNNSNKSSYNQFWSQNQPTSLYNAMVAPIINQKIKGILWYQGESNVWNPKPYYKYLPALIKDYRNKFNQGDLPFLYVQLANFQDVDYSPTESNWAELRDAQLSALTVPNTAMTVTTDLGEWNDIHPLDKEGVGKRLALGAMKLAYGENIVHTGPIFKSSKIDGNKIILSFESVGSGLISIDDEPLNRFEIAADDQKFIWGNAKIVGNTVEISHESIKNPRYVKYAWADNPQGANLYNKEGLPASPFRNYNPDSLNNTIWQGKKAAVILTYDDALNVHLDNVQPLLDSLNLKGTFYVSTYSEAFRKRINDWRKLAQKGHELGNHTLFHPCIGNESRPWVNKNYDMSAYTVERMIDEIKINNTLLEAIDGKKKRTFAYTCGDFTVAEGKSFKEELKKEVFGARAAESKMHTINEIDIYSIDSYAIVEETGDQMIEKVKKAVESNSLLVFLFHGVGGEHSMNISLPAHKKLLTYLKQNEDKIWTTTMIEAIENIQKNQSKK